MGQYLKSSTQSHEIINRHLDSLLVSPDFKATPQQTAMLKFVVAQTLAGNSDTIKGFTVATEVFGRGADFDQNIDPIVSIQAARLRRALERYYQTSGKNEALRIDIPKGTYVPVFEMRSSMPARASGRDAAREPERVNDTWPAVLISPLRNLSGDSELDAWGVGLMTELGDELNRYPNVRVMHPGPNARRRVVEETRAHFVIDGSVRSDNDCLKVILQLTDIRAGGQIWCDSFRAAVTKAATIAFQEHIAKVVAVNVAGKRGWIAKVWEHASETRLPPISQAYDAVLRYDEYKATSNLKAFERAMTATEKALDDDPECGRVLTIRARLFAEAHAFEIPAYGRPLEKAFAYAQNGLRLLPHDQRAHTVMAFIHLLRNDLQAGLAEAERALDLAPETLYMLDGIGYLMTLMGEWERGVALIEDVIRLNPFYGNYVHYALWVNCLRQKQYDQAHQETLKVTHSAHFWDHLAKAATCGLCGYLEEGRRSAADLVGHKPDFPERGRVLIGRFIKFDEIAERIIQGLDAVGVQIR